MLYTLHLDCPIAWPERPPYPIDAVEGEAAHFTSERDLVEDAPVLDRDWLLRAYLDALYGTGDLSEANPISRVEWFAESLRAWLPPVPCEILASRVERLQQLDQRWRFDVPNLLSVESSAGLLLARQEQDALQHAHEQWKGHNENRKDESNKIHDWRRMNFREWLGELETTSHQLQIILVAEILAADSPETLPQEIPPDNSKPDYEAMFDLLTDRLAMHQALNGIGDMLNDNGKTAIQLDDVQSFWQNVFVRHYSGIFPAEFMSMHAEKIFTERLSQDLYDEDSDEESGHAKQILPHLPHATPEILRLARTKQETAYENAQKQASLIPASPTLAKLLGKSSLPANPVNARNTGASKLKRSTSTSRLAFAGRQVKMGPARSLSTETDVAQKGAQSKARTSKRKQASPKKFAASSRTLVLATPGKRAPFSRTTSAPQFGQSFRSAEYGRAFEDIQEDVLPLGVLAMDTPDVKSRRISSSEFQSLGQTPQQST